MCGIVGVFDRSEGRAPDGTVLRRMRDSLTYRGPDAAGMFVAGPVALGIRRLAIIDVMGGTQPITSPDGRYTIVFNGEIYNYQSLRRPLERRFHFRTRSDTEVLLYHLAAHGVEGINDLNGMFAFAFWDDARQELLLARDRFGKKPLYYADLPGAFVFGSEPKALLAVPDVPRALDTDALVQYFLYEYVPTPRTPYRHIRRLPPGALLRVSQRGTEFQQWWTLPVPGPTAPRRSAGEPFERQLDRLLEAAVTDRMVADVPVGVLLSGGIDSSTITWYARRTVPHLHTFSVSFDDPTFDESGYAQAAARALRTEHHDVRFTLDRFFHALDIVRARLDEPLGDASLLPTYIVSEEAKRWVTVVLDGDGADELLCGYNTFPAYQTSLLAEKFPPSWQRAAAAAANALPTSHRYFSLDFKAKSFFHGLPFRGAVRNQVWIGSFDHHDLQRLLQPAFQDAVADIYRPLQNREQQFRHLSPLEQLSAVYLTTYLPEDILVKIDRATMYASVEARTPYLDPRVVAFLLHLPLSARYRWGRGKHLLRRLMRERLPPAILRRPKKGFGIPIGSWLNGPLRSLVQETLDPEKLAAAGMINPTAVQQLLAEHHEGRADHRKKLWTLMVFQWWFERWTSAGDRFGRTL